MKLMNLACLSLLSLALVESHSPGDGPQDVKAQAFSAITDSSSLLMTRLNISEESGRAPKNDEMDSIEFDEEEIGTPLKPELTKQFSAVQKPGSPADQADQARQVPITHVVYKEGTQGNGVDETVTARVRVLPGKKYSVSFEILRNDLGDGHEYVKDVKVDGESLGQCHPDGGDYDCTFFQCPFAAKEISSPTGWVSVSITNTGHSRDCDCDKATWACHKERTVAGLSPMKIVGKFLFELTNWWGDDYCNPEMDYAKCEKSFYETICAKRCYQVIER